VAIEDARIIRSGSMFGVAEHGDVPTQPVDDLLKIG
jgi:hypothetical protein